MPNQSDNAQLRPIDSLGTGARTPAMRLVKDNPKAAAMISKLVVDQRANMQTDIFNQQGAGLNTGTLRGIASEAMQDVNDAETIGQLLSDTELAAQILVSVILSPKDMMGVDPTYKAELSHWRIPHEVNATLTNSVREYFEQVYKIKPKLPTILHDALFKRGCYPVAVLPENAIDAAIHGNAQITVESFANVLKPDGQIKALGILGPLDKDKPKQIRPNLYSRTTGLAMEHMLTHQPDKDWNDNVIFDYDDDKNKAQTFSTGIIVTDNINVLKMPAIGEKIRAQALSKIVGRNSALSTESMLSRMGISNEEIQRVAAPGWVENTPSGHAMMQKVFHRPNTKNIVLTEIKSQDKLKRRSIGMPLEIHFPSESVIPVHVPNQPAKQIGFFVLLDSEGNPVNRGMGINHYRELGQSLQNNSFASAMIQRSGLAMNDNSDPMRGSGMYNVTSRLYGQMLDRDLRQRLKNGLVGGSVSIAGHEEVYRLMLARSLSNQQTQILYIPVEYMTYIAFDYKTNGTGKSLLDSTKIIDSMQAMMLVGTVMGALRNSIGRTQVDLKLDPDHPDPWKAAEIMMGEIMRVNGNGFPLGTIDPLDIKDGLIRSQFQFGFSGHPKLPDMSVEFSEKNSNYNPPDQKVMDDLRKRRLMSFYLTPEQVDAASGADYATSVANNSTLLSKRAMVLQQEFIPQISAHLRKHAINSADLIDEMIEIINGSYKDIMKEFKDNEKIAMFDGSNVTKDQLEKDPLVKAQFIRELIEDFIGGFTLCLPEPDNIKLDNQNEQYKKQGELIDEALKAWISSDMMDASIVGEELANHINVCREQIKSFYLRQWQTKNGVMQELNQLTARGDDGKVELDMAEIQATHNEGIMEMLIALLTANKKAREKNAEALKKAGVEESSGSSSYDSSSSGGDDGFGGGGGGDEFGAGDFNADLGGDLSPEPEIPADGEATPEGGGADPAATDTPTDGDAANKNAGGDNQNEEVPENEKPKTDGDLAEGDET